MCVGEPFAHRSPGIVEGRVRKLLVLGGVICLTAVVLSVTVVALAPAARQLATAASGEPEQIDVAALDNFAVRSQVYAHDGTPLATLHGPENREPVPLTSVPQPLSTRSSRSKTPTSTNTKG